MAEQKVQYEHHEGGGSIWVRVDPPIAKWVCVWSTSVGNVGQYLREIPSAVPAPGIRIPAAWLEGE